MLTHKSCPDLALLPKLRSSGGGFHISVMRRRIPIASSNQTLRQPTTSSVDHRIKRLVLALQRQDSFVQSHAFINVNE
jgi:hypothetical protein